MLTLNELVSSKRDKLACAPNKDRSTCTSLQSDQSLMGALWGAKGPGFSIGGKTETDQTALHGCAD